jgi:hypothetical protein
LNTPWDFYRELLADKMPTLDRCSALARKRGQFGDLTAHFDHRTKTRVDVQATKSLGTDVRQCVLAELQPYAKKVYELLGNATDFDVSWQLGTPRPLFPTGDGFLRAWSEAASAASPKAASERFARMLPPDVKLVDRCLVLQPPAKFAFSEAVELWRKKSDVKDVDAFWNGKLGAVTEAKDARFSLVSSPSSHLLVQVERHDVGRETDPRTAMYPPRRAAPSKNELCLRPFDEQLVAQVMKAMSAAGRCWRNGPVESLAAPRFSFPAGRTYTRVGSSAAGSACALDVAGEITCCGPTTTTLPGRYQDLDVAGNLACNVSATGEASCVDLGDGRRVVTLAGKFQRVSASTAGACGIDANGAVVCEWKVARAERPPRGTFREVDAGALCAIDQSGALICWAGGRAERVGTGPWRHLTTGKTDNSTACALDAAGQAWCWSTDRPSTSLAREPIAAALSRIVMGSVGACGIDASCGLHCWKGKVPFRDQGLCARDMSLGNPSCVVSRSGSVWCGGFELWVDDSMTKGGK